MQFGRAGAASTTARSRRALSRGGGGAGGGHRPANRAGAAGGASAGGGRRDRVEQILLNLLANALKFAPLDRPVRLSLRREGMVARIAVCDEGPGITPDDLARVFERFYRAPGADASGSNGAAGGLGLGLYIARGLVERHGGAITVESVPGRGATVLHAAAGAPGARPHHPSLAPSTAGANDRHAVC